MSNSHFSRTRPRTGRRLSAAQLTLGALAGLCFAAPFVYDGPPPGDPSAWTDLVLGTDPHVGPVHMAEGTFEGGLTGTTDDATMNNSRDGQHSGGTFDLPSGGPPSPLYGVQSFTQQMLRFEEFGLQPMETQYIPGAPFPDPATAQECPDGPAVDAFIFQPMYPEPTGFSNIVDQNPWKGQIENYLGHTLAEAPAEGRPPGEGWSHQRMDEFPPEAYFTSVQTGARTNNGGRDHLQNHGYSHGGGFSEFGPGGLYYNTAGTLGTEGTTAGIDIRFHPDMPLQDPLALWTFDGTLPPKLLMSRVGQPTLFRHYNGLPIDISANRGFGAHTITTHEHNGHSPAESDGYANAFFFPGQFYDYRWPMALAGHDTINTGAADPRAGYPDGNGGIVNIPGDFRETMSTHWFHDHMLDFTSQNVYKGNAAMMNYYSAIDRGNEALDDGINLRLPSGSSLDWGNRDFDVNMVIACKAWDEDGQLWLNPFQNDGFLGDQILTNWLYHPFMEVRSRRYRLRLLNGSVARYFKFAVVHQIQGLGGEMPGPAGSGVSYDRVPFHLVANDGNIMAHAIHMDGSTGLNSGELPVQGIAERFDIIVDFAQFQPGEKLYMVNLLEHKGGRRPERPISLAAVLSESYKGVAVDTDRDGVADRWVGGDPTVGRFLEFQVRAMEPGQVDLSMDPENYEPGRNVMLEQPLFTAEELQNARRRTFEFGRSSGTDELPWTIKSLDGAFNMDPRRLTAAPNIGEVEIWTLQNNSGGWSHPVHVHFEEGKILRRDGKPAPMWERFGRKDIYRIGPDESAGKTVELAMRFREFNGTYMEHCHNTTHEDTAMLMRWDIEHPGQFKLMPAPLPTWGGCEYVDSFGLEHFRVGDNNVPPGGGGGQGPLANPDFGQVAAGGATTLAVLANDQAFGDAQLVAASVNLVTLPASGTASVNAKGIVSYQSVASTQSSQVQFSYIVSDSNGLVSNEATVTVLVAGSGGGGGKQDPVAHSDFGQIAAGGALNLVILANDQAFGGATLDPATVTLVSLPGVGSASVDAVGVVNYASEPSLEDLNVQFNYQVSDSNGAQSNIATITVFVTGTGGGGGGGGGGGVAPRAVYDSAGVDAGAAVEIDLAANDSDSDDDLDIESIVIHQSPGQGTVELLTGGIVRYTPTVTSSSSDAFSYSISDLAGNRSNQATVGVQIMGSPGGGRAAPQANYDGATVTSGTPEVIQILANDTDADGDLDPSSVQITQIPGHGTVEVLADGSVRYSTSIGINTSDTFNYTVSDAAGHVSNIATVGVTITGGSR
jgi:FtsP/CotA-like multicopper oxidase with cupredoxin domain